MLDIYSPLARGGRAVHRHRRRDGRADQVRLERLPGHQDLVHQRGGRDLRGLAAPTSKWWPRAWAWTAGSARSSFTPAPASAAPASPRTPAPWRRSPASSGLRFEIIDAVLEVNERVQARMLEKIEQALGGARPARRSRFSASRSRPTPTTCASRPAPADRRRRCSTRGAARARLRSRGHGRLPADASRIGRLLRRRLRRGRGRRRGW